MPAKDFVVLLIITLLSACVQAQHGGYASDGGGDSNGCPPWDDDCNDNNDDGNGSGLNGFSQSGFSSLGSFDHATHVLIAHAVLASLVWVLFIPTLAILLRLNLKNPIVLKIHAMGQILSYLVYIAAAGMGIWLAQQSARSGVWKDAHPRLGLAILTLTFFQPIFGAVHHSIYKNRAEATDAGRPTEPPGRTVPGHMHLWLGRSLIVLGIVNGGLGIRLASRSPFQSDSTSTKAKIAYGVVASAMFLLYLVFVVMFEVRRKRNVSTRVDVREKTGMGNTARPTYA